MRQYGKSGQLPNIDTTALLIIPAGQDPGGKIVVDGIHTSVQMPGDKDGRGEYRGRKKGFTASTAVVANADGPVPYAEVPHAGNTHCLMALGGTARTLAS